LDTTGKADNYNGDSMIYNMDFSIMFASVYVEADSEEEAEKKLNEGVYLAIEPKSGIDHNDGGEIEVHEIDEMPI